MWRRKTLQQIGSRKSAKTDKCAPQGDQMSVFFFFFASYIYSTLTQNNKKRSDVTFCFMLGASPRYMNLGGLHRHPLLFLLIKTWIMRTMLDLFKQCIRFSYQTILALFWFVLHQASNTFYRQILYHCSVVCGGCFLLISRDKIMQAWVRPRGGNTSGAAIVSLGTAVNSSPRPDEFVKKSPKM
jgi:hypothetical protein